jgi:anti-sigma B factor antagonist
MQIQEQHQEGVLILRVGAQLDSTTGPALGEKLQEVIDAGHTHLVLDLEEVPYISSAGLRVLSTALKTVRSREAGGDLCLTRLSKTVAHAFRISGFNQIFNIYDTVPEAVAVLVASREFDAG